MENFVDTIMALAIGTAAFPPELMILGVIGLVILGSLVTPWIGPLLRATARVLPYLARRLWTIAVNKLITCLALALLALLGGIAWLAELVDIAAMLLK